ncbi:hypothetical protein H4R18_004112 [Coemansia javaensis]|uniref:Uncharacterized protein n=1 Tax=Coemansia javaensis TaxID=2761396 RepID=A0A9W8HCM1_9FUNG|nr:hypothetical protein H4R18_004112 [Coemansia javaensis]
MPVPAAPAAAAVPEPSFCSHQCAYLHTLDAFRRSATAYLLPDTATVDPPQGTHQHHQLLPRFGRCHTFMLIRCGIDPWASPAEIRMRQQSCHALVRVLSRYPSAASIADYAWPLENMSYCLSHLPQYSHSWEAAAKAVSGSSNSNKDLSCVQRYHMLCAALVSRIEDNMSYVGALLSGHLHPSEFYVAAFGR